MGRDYRRKPRWGKDLQPGACPLVEGGGCVPLTEGVGFFHLEWGGWGSNGKQ